MNFKGIWIKKEVWLLTDLTIMEKLFLTDIESLDNSKRGCYASNNYFSDFFDISKGRCSQIITSLEKKGYLKISYKKEGKQIIERNIKVVNKLNRVFRKLNEGSKYSKRGYLENAQENNTLLNNTKDIYAEFLNLFNKSINRKFRVLDDKAKRQLKARLKEGYSIENLIDATINCSKDKFHIENKQYLTPEFITRLDKLQKYFQETEKKVNGFTHVTFKYFGNAKRILTISEYEKIKESIKHNQFEIKPTFINHE